MNLERESAKQFALVAADIAWSFFVAVVVVFSIFVILGGS